MPGPAFRLLSALAACALSCIAAAAGAPDAAREEPPLLRIGYIEQSFTPSERAGFEATFGYLREKLPGYRIEVRNLLVRDLEQAVERGEFEFFIGASGFYRRIFRRGLRDLATLTTALAPNPDRAIGAVFLVPLDSPARDVEDLRGLRAAVNWEGGFSEFFVPLGEIAARGHDPDRFFSRVVAAGSPMKKLLVAVEEGRADVALARSCTLEELRLAEPEFAARFRPVGLKENTDGFSCWRSTELYPSWTFTATPAAPWQASRDITVALLSMPAAEGGMAWGVASEFLRVDELYRTLRAGPYSYLRIRTAGDFLRQYWPWLMLAAVLVLGLALHSRRADRLVEVRTRELCESVEKEKAALQEVQQAREKLAAMEHVTVIGAMSSLIAHEINGPVSAIANSCNALERLLESRGTPDAMVERTVALVLRQCSRIAEIVRHVRAYAKNRESPLEPVELAPVISRAAATRRLRHPGVGISVSLPEEKITADWNPLEFELCVSNLVKNAAEACAGMGQGAKVSVTLARGGPGAIVTVADNAPTTAEYLADHTRPLNTGKESGTGLGLLIVRTLVEKAGGSFSIARRGDATEARLSIPVRPGSGE